LLENLPVPTSSLDFENIISRRKEVKIDRVAKKLLKILHPYPS